MSNRAEVFQPLANLSISDGLPQVGRFTLQRLQCLCCQNTLLAPGSTQSLTHTRASSMKAFRHQHRADGQAKALLRQRQTLSTLHRNPHGRLEQRRHSERELRPSGYGCSCAWQGHLLPLYVQVKRETPVQIECVFQTDQSGRSFDVRL